MDARSEPDAGTADPAPPIPAVPRAVARLQFTADFGFDAARARVPYLASLGISHLYASPFLQARPGSSHGYDIVDHARLNAELGDEAAFNALVDTLHAHGMGLILDFVPNHMGVGGSDNPWWLDVLEWGQASPYAPFFDIGWDANGDGRLLLPVLGDQYGAVLERGELELRLESGQFGIRYFDHRFPVAVRDYPKLLRLAWEQVEPAEDRTRLGEIANAFAALGPPARTVQKQAMARRGAEELKRRLALLMEECAPARDGIAAMLARFNGQPGRRDSFTALHGLLERQSWRIAFWRVAADEINYRRFFDINELAGLRIEREDLFELAHALVFRLIGEGRLQGLRIDHIDGLFDPKAYVERVQTRAAYLTDRPLAPTAPPPEPGAPRLGQPLHVVVEKILAPHERLREDWPVAGTTGYEFMVQAVGLFVDPAAEAAMTDTYETFIERPAPFDEMQVEAKRLILSRNLSAELNVLAAELHALAQGDWSSRDHTRTGIRRALAEIVAHFPVYRTYVTEAGPGDGDRRDIDWAVGRAKKAAQAAVDLSVYDFLHAALTTDLCRHRSQPDERAEIVRIAMKAQQFTGPVMAKAVEDTLFYRFVRLACLNEVGGAPDRFGGSVAAFHRSNQERQRRWPHQLVTLATHDHKRGADTRVRMAVLSEHPQEWSRRVRRWARLNRLKKREIEDKPGPGRNDEYLLYQTLAGAWPLDLSPGDAAGLNAFRDRISTYMLKAVRESKYRSNWAQPAAEYEDSLARFVEAVLDPQRSGAFLEDMADFVARIAPVGALNGLAQVLLAATVPGVPDLYQGTECWDLSLVDPDNRRPVDWERRRESLADPKPADQLLESWRDGRIKQRVWVEALRLRNQFPALFADGDYLPVEASGAAADRIVAFLRRRAGEAVLVAVPRLAAPLVGDGTAPMVPPEAWADTLLHVPELPEGATLTDRFTGAAVRPDADGRLTVASLLSRFPLALATTHGG